MREQFRGIFRGRKVLVTGDTGFKGSWLCIWLRELGADVYGFALPPKTPEDNFVRSGLSGLICHQDGNIIDYEAFLQFALKVQPEIVFHLAAQPLVIYSYENPRFTYETNLMGTVNLLEIVRSISCVKVALNVTSDKCYENQDWVWGYRESDPMGGKDPYSSSKGCSELITRAYIHSYFNKTGAVISTARAGNVIGGGDWAQDRIVPDFFRAWKGNRSIIIRNPQHTRPWQFVLEPLSGYLQLAATMYQEGRKYSGGWNFGPLDNNHHSVVKLVESIIDTFGYGSYSIPQGDDRPHEAHLLKLDISKAMKILEWSPVLNYKEMIDFTVKGYEAEWSGKNVYSQRVEQIKTYTDLAKNKGVQWVS